MQLSLHFKEIIPKLKKMNIRIIIITLEYSGGTTKNKTYHTMIDILLNLYNKTTERKNHPFCHTSQIRQKNQLKFHLPNSLMYIKKNECVKISPKYVFFSLVYVEYNI